MTRGLPLRLGRMGRPRELGLFRRFRNRARRSEGDDHVEAVGELAGRVAAVVDGVVGGEVISGLGADPEPGLGLVDHAEGELVVGAGRAGAGTVLVAPDFRTPDAGQLLVEAVEEPVPEAVPARALLAGAGAAGGLEAGDLGFEAVVDFHDLGQLVVPLVGEDVGEERAVVLGIGRVGAGPDVAGAGAGRDDVDPGGDVGGELVGALDGGDGEVGLVLVEGPGEAADVAPAVGLVEPAVPAVDRTVVDADLVGEVEVGQHARVGERLAVVEHVGHREQRAAGRRHHFIAGQGVPAAQLDVDALAEDRQVAFEVELGGVVAEPARDERVVQQAVHLVERPVVAEQVVQPEAEVDLVVLLDGLLEDEVVLVPHPGVGLVVGRDAEVDVVGGIGPVRGEGVLDPAVDLDLGILAAEEVGQELGLVAGGRGLGGALLGRGLIAGEAVLGGGQVIGCDRRGGRGGRRGVLDRVLDPADVRVDRLGRSRLAGDGHGRASDGLGGGLGQRGEIGTLLGPG